MIYLLLSILFSTGLFVIFKYFGIYKVDILKAIFVNYIVALLLGFTLAERSFSIAEMAKTAQINGVSVASVAGKMSVVIPVFFGVFLYNESVTFLKILGIIIALIAVYLASVKEEKSTRKNASLLFPILLFLGSGVIDTTVLYRTTRTFKFLCKNCN